MSSTERSSEGSSGRERPTARNIASGLMLGAALLMGAGTPAFAQNRGGGGHPHGGGAPSHGGGQPHSMPARPAPPARHYNAPQTRNNAPRYNNAPQRHYNAPPNRARTNVTVNRNRDVYVRRNTVVRPAPRPYGRAPYAYGGRRYYAYHPYVYHRYRPYYYGPAFHPFGFVAATLAATAIAVTVASQPYSYDQGVWYAPAPDGGYAVVTAPVGATVAALPPGAVAVSPNVYYYGGAYYQAGPGGYAVVAPQAGMVVDELPPGGEEVSIGAQTYVRFGETYYQPFEQDGRARYEVVQVQ